MSSTRTFVAGPAKTLCIIAAAVASLATSSVEDFPEEVLGDIQDTLGPDTVFTAHRLTVGGESHDGEGKLEGLLSVRSTVRFDAPEGSGPAMLRVELMTSSGEGIAFADDSTIEIVAGGSTTLSLDVPIEFQCAATPCEQEAWLTLERIDEEIAGQMDIDSSIETSGFSVALASDDLEVSVD